MRLSDVIPISLLAGLFAALGARAALAVEPTRCTQMVVEADISLRDRWPDLPGQIRAAFEIRGDIDTCARIELVMPNATIVVRVALPDGRTASRSVARREDVLPALEALLLLPEDSATVASGTSGKATHEGDQGQAKVVTPAAHPAATLSQRIVEQPTRPPADVPAQLRVDLSLAAGARVGDGYMGFGVGLVSFLHMSRWLLGFQGELNLYQPVGAGDVGQPMVDEAREVALELGVLAGRRFPFRVGTLDLAAGPALALHGATTSVTQQAPTGMAVSQTSSNGGLPRLVVSSRFSFGRRSLLRSFVEADGEIGRTGTSPLTGAPRLPAWTVGLAVGVVVGAP